MTRIQRIVEAIRDSERCPDYAPEDPEDDTEPCDGLMGCQDCLELAAFAVVDVLALPDEEE